MPLASCCNADTPRLLIALQKLDLDTRRAMHQGMAQLSLSLQGLLIPILTVLASMFGSRTLERD